MKKTFVDVMLELPVDATLRDFLTSHGLPVPSKWTIRNKTLATKGVFYT